MTEGCFQRVAVEYWSTKCNHCKILSSFNIINCQATPDDKILQWLHFVDQYSTATRWKQPSVI